MGITLWNISNLAIFEPGEKGVFLAFLAFLEPGGKIILEGKRLLWPVGLLCCAMMLWGTLLDSVCMFLELFCLLFNVF